MRCGWLAIGVHFFLGGSTFFVDVHFVRPERHEAVFARMCDSATYFVQFA